MKDVVNYTYSNRAETAIRKEYDKFIDKKANLEKDLLKFFLDILIFLFMK